MTITLEQARRLSVAEITGLSAQDLMQLQSAVAGSLRQARDLKEWIDGAIAFKYDAQAKALHAQLGKDTGTIHFDDQGLRVTSDLPRKPVWDQKKLSEIAERITANGDDPPSTWTSPTRSPSASTRPGLRTCARCSRPPAQDR